VIEFKHCFVRTGVLVTESKEYYKKVDFSTINKVLKSFNIFGIYDAFEEKRDFSLPILEEISVTCTNYGIYLKPLHAKYQTYIIEKFINSNSELQQKQNIDLSFKDSISKYHGETRSNIEIENLIILSSKQKWVDYDWSLINRMVKKQNSFIKLHPIFTEDDKKFLAKKFGKHKLIDSNYTADGLIANAKNVGIGASSETLITSNLLDKKIEFLNVSNPKSILLYTTVYEGLKKGYHINELINSLVFNLIPWNYIHDETIIKNNIEFIREQNAECHKF